LETFLQIFRQRKAIPSTFQKHTNKGLASPFE